MQNSTLPPSGNTGIVPPWLTHPITLPVEPPEQDARVLNVTLLRSERPLTLRHGYIDAVLAAGAVS